MRVFHNSFMVVHRPINDLIYPIRERDAISDDFKGCVVQPLSLKSLRVYCHLRQRVIRIGIMSLVHRYQRRRFLGLVRASCIRVAELRVELEYSVCVGWDATDV